MSALPVELLDIIFSYVKEETRIGEYWANYNAFSLVCKHWAPLAQKYIFHHICLNIDEDGVSDISRLLITIDANLTHNFKPSPLNHTRHLTILPGNGPLASDAYEESSALLTYFPSIISLTLGSSYTTPRTNKSKTIFGTRRRTARRQPHVHVHHTEPPVETVWKEAEFLQRQVELTLPSTLRYLSLVPPSTETPVEEFYSWLSQSKLISRVERLEVRLVRAEDYDSVVEVIEGAQPSIKELSLCLYGLDSAEEILDLSSASHIEVLSLGLTGGRTNADDLYKVNRSLATLPRNNRIRALHLDFIPRGFFRDGRVRRAEELVDLAMPALCELAELMVFGVESDNGSEESNSTTPSNSGDIDDAYGAGSVCTQFPRLRLLRFYASPPSSGPGVPKDDTTFLPRCEVAIREYLPEIMNPESGVGMARVRDSGERYSLRRVWSRGCRRGY